MIMDFISGVPSRPGPEAEIVHDFIDYALPKSTNGGRSCIFVEPKLVRSQPDIVLVYWNPSKIKSWSETRLNLKPSDFQLVHLLFISGPLRDNQLENHFKRRLNPLLERLKRAKIIKRLDEEWHLGDINELFFIDHIITYEAKISAVSKAIDQAFLNIWFASESYVLTNSSNPRSHTLKRARVRGVGLCTISDRKHVKILVNPKYNPLPRSYASWIINELTWRHIVGVNEWATV